MSAGAPPTAPTPIPVPSAPPEEEFWERYSPHYEFPLSSIGAVALHIAFLLVFLGMLWLLAKFTFNDKEPVPMRAMALVGDGDGEDGKGTGGGDLPENNTPFDVPMEPTKVQEIPIEKVKEMEHLFPKLPTPDEGLHPEQLDAARKISKLNDDVRKIILEGQGGKRGKGPGDGEGTSGVPGTGSSNRGDATSSSNRAMRWELVFRTADGKDYLAQLAAMRATLVLPQPSDFSTLKVYRDLSSPVGSPFSRNELPGLHFIDDDAGSASRLAKALGVDFTPPYFIAFFPKDIEEELATKERAYRGRSENEIFSTKFKILIRDGKPSITVVDQVPVRR